MLRTIIFGYVLGFLQGYLIGLPLVLLSSHYKKAIKFFRISELLVTKNITLIIFFVFYYFVYFFPIMFIVGFLDSEIGPAWSKGNVIGILFFPFILGIEKVLKRMKKKI